MTKLEKLIDIIRRRKLIFLILLSFIILVVLPILLYCLFITPSDFGFIKPNDTGAWLGYYGAVLGGAITLSGVLITIRFQQKENDKNRSIEYKPILELAGSDFPKEMIPFRTVSLGIPTYGTPDFPKHYKEIEKQTIELCITNKGRGETFHNASVEYEVNKETINWTEANNINSTTSQQSIGEILPGQILGIRIELPPFLLIREEVFNQNIFVELDTILTFEYRDMFNRMKYQYDLHIRFHAYLLKHELEESGVPNLIAVRVEYELKQIMPVRKQTL
ncbi:hypothetical protein [Mesobacillus subterraneus]|uniref:hypothetical protein n=1 Tax=Mesobacillus subterraneus TaxID=285983 RepID=UPI001CFD2068|nr:hypothetical protein [Mesobacillus subterraneus]